MLYLKAKLLHVLIIVSHFVQNLIIQKLGKEKKKTKSSVLLEAIEAVTLAEVVV